MKEQLLIAGAGGHGKVVADAAMASGWKHVAFLDDYFQGSLLPRCPVVGKFDEVEKQLEKYTAIIIAIGDNQRRLEFIRQVAIIGYQLPVLKHPSAIVSRFSEVGEGTVALTLSVVNTGARIGRGCILNTGCSVDHDCMLGDGVHISPGARLAGGVSVGKLSWIGMGASVVPGVQIGKSAVIGAGAVIIRDVPDCAKVVGVPGRIIGEVGRTLE